jgi:hypothetical protein
MWGEEELEKATKKEKQKETQRTNELDWKLEHEMTKLSTGKYELSVLGKGYSQLSRILSTIPA